jgi:ribosome-binding protein aMBF1 (putative translation factor)
MEHQNWETTVIHGKPSASSTKRVQVEKRNPEAQRLAKIEREDFVKPKQLSSESRKDLVAARVALKLNQEQLNQRCAFPPHTIKAFEAGHLTPSGGQLNRLNRELKTSLHLE